MKKVSELDLRDLNNMNECSVDNNTAYIRVLFEGGFSEKYILSNAEDADILIENQEEEIAIYTIDKEGKQCYTIFNPEKIMSISIYEGNKTT